MTQKDDITILRDPLTQEPTQTSQVSGRALPAASEDENPTPKILKQRFVLEEKLGSGGMGTVYRARDLRKVEARDRHPFVAIKLLNHDFRRHPEAFVALEREASKSQTLSHPNIVSIFDFDKDGDLPFITMEVLEGRELTELLQQFPDGIPDELAWPIIEGLCAGLRYAHEAGVVHADFKPGNVLVTGSDHAKILDFGIARAVQIHPQGGGEQTVFDPKRLAALTPAYASLEMLTGQTPEMSDDIFSFGIVVYLILTGRHPYDRVSAKDAQAKGMKLVRPRNLSGRHWKIIERCLAFHRADRPESMADVERALTHKHSITPRTAIFVGALVLAILAYNFFQGEAELIEVKEEVRATTLLDAQAERIQNLLAQATFDSGWHNSLVAEMQTLQGLGGAEDLASGYSAQISAAYTEAILNSSSLNKALGMYRDGLQFGELPAAATRLQERLENRILTLLDEPKASVQYLLRLESAFRRATNQFPLFHRWAELNLLAVDVLETLVSESIAAGDLKLADEALSRLSPRMFLHPVILGLADEIEQARNKNAQTVAAIAVAKSDQEFDQALVGLVSGSCMRLDVSALQQRYTSLVERFPAKRAAVTAAVDTEMVRCYNQLEAVGAERAGVFRTEVLAQFGELSKLSALRADPCAHAYLIGNGAQPGRRGYCADGVLVAGSMTPVAGPRLVVIPSSGDAVSFAITREEISQDWYNGYCRSTEQCLAQPSTALPVVNVGVANVQAFANWLSLSSGYTYSLPTHAQWQRAVGEAPDPNRNCRVQAAGVERGLAPLEVGAGQAGEFGLVHGLGNVREWVRIGNNYAAAGGSYRDPLEACLASALENVPTSGDEVTGFRLVREIP